MTFKPTEKDKEQLAQLGLTVERVQEQIDHFKKGFPKCQLDAAATIANNGIRQLNDKEIKRYTKLYHTLSKNKKILKFVPASGAATRMFKDLYTFSSTYFGVATNFEKEFPTIKEFLENIHTFAFFNDLKACMERSDLDIEEYLQRGAEVKQYYEATFGIKLHITFSEQKHYTDIIAVDEQNNPVRDEEGKLMFRPGGHGALIENLHEQHADLIFVKNIDNVVPDWMKHTTVIYKEVLAGMLLDLQQKTFDMLRKLKGRPDTKELKKAEKFACNELGISLPDGYNKMDATQRKAELIRLLNRPMRICGMVKNQGEPGGGPFYTIDSQGRKSLQIVESAQINHNDPKQESIFASSTHFNPVDLVCSTKDYRGRYFDLRQYVDPMTGFISKKSKGALVVKSQELPGLWNGAMAHWITLFVEVPIATFNPVKTVNDLLRKEHREG